MKRMMAKIGMALLIIGFMTTSLSSMETVAGDEIKEAGSGVVFLHRGKPENWATLAGSLMIISGTIIALVCREKCFPNED